jgi:hypothetical protein
VYQTRDNQQVWVDFGKCRGKVVVARSIAFNPGNRVVEGDARSEVGKWPEDGVAAIWEH